MSVLVELVHSVLTTSPGMTTTANVDEMRNLNETSFKPQQEHPSTLSFVHSTSDASHISLKPRSISWRSEIPNLHLAEARLPVTKVEWRRLFTLFAHCTIKSSLIWFVSSQFLCTIVYHPAFSISKIHTTSWHHTMTSSSFTTNSPPSLER